MGMMTIAVKNRASPTEVDTFRVTSLSVDGEGQIVAERAGPGDGSIIIDPDLFVTVINTFDWGGD